MKETGSGILRSPISSRTPGHHLDRAGVDEGEESVDQRFRATWNNTFTVSPVDTTRPVDGAHIAPDMRRLANYQPEPSARSPHCSAARH